MPCRVPTTPSSPSARPRARAANSIAACRDGPIVVINKSTVPPLTGDMVTSVLRKHPRGHEAAVVSNPEFLREGSAIHDFMHPDRVVIGSHDRDAADKD